jgi:hypothetical protein
LLSVLIHFFEHGRWGSPADVGVEGQELTVEDQLFILTQARLYLTATRGLASPEARICCERAESLCRSLDHRSFLYSALKGQWFYSLMTAPANGTNKPPNAGPIIPEMLNCKPLKVAAEGNSVSETT